MQQYIKMSFKNISSKMYFRRNKLKCLKIEKYHQKKKI